MINSTEKTAIKKWSNSIIRPLVPYNLMEKSTILKTHDDGAKLVYVKFLFGLKTGKAGVIPFDGTYGNKIEDINEESLWLYGDSTYIAPDGFVAKKYEQSHIRTGKNRKCNRCSGQGLVTCRTCGGKIKWKENKLNGDVVEMTCSCGNGKENCGTCEGFGDTEDVIIMNTSFKLDESKNSQYTGEVPEQDIKRVTGELIYEKQFDYPIELIKKLLKGGISMEEMNQLNNFQLQTIKSSLESDISDDDIDTETIYEQLVSLFDNIQQMASENNVLEREFLPVRVLVRVENAPVKQIDYTFKDKQFSLWLYGAENQIWKKEVPAAFNVKIGIILGVLVAITTTFTVLSFI